MAAKEMMFGDEAWRKLDKGVSKVANAVKITLGPRGRNVVLEKKWGSPTITNDGVTIAKEIDLEDPYENMGAQLLKEIASTTGGIYYRSTRGELEVDRLVREIRRMTQKGLKSDKIIEYEESYQAVLVVAFLLLLAEMALSERKKQ